MIVPMFHDFATHAGDGQVAAVPWSQWSLIVRRCTSMLPGTLSLVFSVDQAGVGERGHRDHLLPLPGS